MINPGDQGRQLEELQFSLQAAGYGTEQVADGPKSVLLDVWHPARRARCLTVHVTIRSGRLVFLSHLGTRNAKDTDATSHAMMVDLARYALGDPTGNR